jgi:hypothetical protein
MLFRGKQKPASLAHTLVGEWHAETLSGDVRGEITAVFNTDGSYQTRNRMEIRGVPAPPVTQTGRYRIEPIDKQRFKLVAIFGSQCCNRIGIQPGRRRTIGPRVI